MIMYIMFFCGILFDGIKELSTLATIVAAFSATVAEFGDSRRIRRHTGDCRRIRRL